MYTIKFHPDFFKDLNELSNKEVEIFEKKKEKIKENPTLLKHLSGGQNCYREPITSNVRVIYYVEENTIYMLIIDKHYTAYQQYRKRLHTLKTKYFGGEKI